MPIARVESIRFVAVDREDAPRPKTVKQFAAFLERVEPLKLAKKLRISPGMVSFLKKGKRMPSLKLAMAIERASAGTVPLSCWSRTRVSFR